MLKPQIRSLPKILCFFTLVVLYKVYLGNMKSIIIIIILNLFILKHFYTQVGPLVFSSVSNLNNMEISGVHSIQLTVREESRVSLMIINAIELRLA